MLNTMNQKMPKKWNKRIILPLHNLRQCDNYINEGTSQDYRTKNIRKSRRLEDMEFGSRKGKITQNALIILKQIIEITGKNKGVNALFMNLEKPYNKIKRNYIWSNLRKKEIIYEERKKVLKAMYRNLAHSCFQWNCSQTIGF